MRIKEREYRDLSSLLKPAEKNSDYYVEGYAATFTRYELFEFGGMRYYEEISPGAFDGADISDVIMQYDHTGKVLARLRNNTLGIEPDEKGLFVYADLSKSAAARELYEEIAAGLVDRMSWAFTIAEQELQNLDEHTRLIIIKAIKKIYDVSAVSLPANDDTEISARSLLNAERERRVRLLKLKIQLGGL